jgi:uncharacterized coiled-coil DUF342 family protein
VSLVRIQPEDFIKEFYVGLEKDREEIRELKASVSSLQEVVVTIANIAHSCHEKIKELEEDHLKLRRQFTHPLSASIPSGE